jgi:hypothetical protein
MILGAGGLVAFVFAASWPASRRVETLEGMGFGRHGERVFLARGKMDCCSGERTSGAKARLIRETLSARINAKHLAAYLTEMEFRFNRRKNHNLFIEALRHMVTAPALTFEKLTV